MGWDWPGTGKAVLLDVLGYYCGVSDVAVYPCMAIIDLDSYTT